MKRLSLLSAFAALFVSCGIYAPPRDDAQWVTTTHGVQVTWRYVEPRGLGGSVGRAHWVLYGGNCVVDLDAATRQFVLVAAHEYGHCAQARYNLAGIPRPDLGDYYAGGQEGYAETYALAYVAACGQSLRPLGWRDYRAPMCEEAPDPRKIERPDPAMLQAFTMPL